VSPGRRRGLLVTHEASRSGAPRVAVLSARVLAADHDVVVLSRLPGPLLPDFEAVAPTPLERLYRVRRRVRTRWAALALLADRLMALYVVARHRPDVVFTF